MAPYSSPPAYSRSDRFASFVLSVLLHGGIIVALAYGWYLFRPPPMPAPTLAIDAVPVDARTVRGLLRAPPPKEETPPPPPPQSEGPPQPTPQEIAQRQEALKEQAEQEQKAAEAQRQRQEQEQAAAAQAAQEKLAEEQRQAQEEAQRKAAEEAAAALKKKQAEEAAAAAAAKKAAAEKLAQEQQEKEQEEEQEKEAQADLQRSLAAEEEQDKLAQLRASGALASWQSAITARIRRAWIPPPTAHPGIDCVLYVTQQPGGQVSNVRMGSCNGDQAVRDSIQAAVYRASPLPPPPDPALFDSNLTIDFKPSSSPQ